MNLGTIVIPNSKGQIVIPYMIRKSLGIGADTPLQMMLSGQSIVLHPIEGVVRRGDSQDEIFAEILRRTAGAWGPATEEDKRRETRRKRIEQAASRKRKKAW